MVSSTCIVFDLQWGAAKKGANEVSDFIDDLEEGVVVYCIHTLCSTQATLACSM